MNNQHSRPSHSPKTNQGRLNQSLGAGLTILLLCSAGIGFSAQAQQTQTPTNTQVAPQTQTLIYVNPATGQDQTGAGQSASAPYRTITFALQQAQSGTTIVLAPGNYSTQSGEKFPLTLKPKVSLKGEETNKGETVVITGGGPISSSYFGTQDATILVNYSAPDSRISGVTVTNPNKRGTGLWIESTNTLVSSSTFKGSARDGLFVTGSGTPLVENSIFINNVANGASVANEAKGEFRNNLFQNTGFGMSINGTATPQLLSNNFAQNKTGVVVSGSARPVLRQNVFQNNERGVTIIAFSQGQPDLGTQAEPGQNTFQGNTSYAVYNAARESMVSAVGNQLDPGQVAGQVSLGETQTAGANFSDTQGTWAAPYIQALAARNIIRGFPNGTFRPNDPVTRAQFAAILAKAFMPTPEKSPTNFKDVSADFWASSVIRNVSSSAFMAGYPDQTFRPSQKIPRVESLVSLASGLKLPSGDSQVLSLYQDQAKIPGYAKPKVAAATQQKIVVNYPTLTQLAPLENASRAEIAAFVYQALVNAGKAEPINSPYVVVPPSAAGSSAVESPAPATTP